MLRACFNVLLLPQSLVLIPFTNLTAGTDVAKLVGVVIIFGRQMRESNRAQELCKNRGGRPGLPVPNSPYGVCGRKAVLNLNVVIKSCSGVVVAVLSSPYLIVLMVFVDAKQY